MIIVNFSHLFTRASNFAWPFDSNIYVAIRVGERERDQNLQLENFQKIVSPNQSECVSTKRIRNRCAKILHKNTQNFMGKVLRLYCYSIYSLYFFQHFVFFLVFVVVSLFFV